MLYKLKMETMSEKHEKNFGKWRTLPPNFKELTEKEFSQSQFFLYSPELIEYRQTDLTPEQLTEFKFKHSPTLWLYYFHLGEGYAFFNDYWGGKVRYFFFASCVHEWRNPTDIEIAGGVTRPRMCLHVSVCNKCKVVREIDSSD